MGEAKRKQAQPAQPRAQERGDATIVFASAGGFRRCFQGFRSRMGTLEINVAHVEAAKDAGSMIASAVNVAFSIELYLKALRILRNQRPNRTHDLSALYMELPTEVRESIEAEYETVPKPDPVGPAIALQVQIAHKDASAQDRASSMKGPIDHSLPAVLQRSRAVFETWRYLLDQGEPRKVKVLNYEFHYLGVAADVLHAHVARELEKLAAEQRLRQAMGQGR